MSTDSSSFVVACVGISQRSSTTFAMSHCCGPNGPDTRPTSRRQFLRHAGGGFGMLALTALLNRDTLSRPPLAGRSRIRLRPRVPLRREGAARDLPLHVRWPEPRGSLRPKAGPDPTRGPAHSGIIRHVQDAAGGRQEQAARAAATFSTAWQCGMEISDFLPHIASCADDLCLLRGCHGDSVTHPESVYQMNTGST